jgi:WD40 repeat protein
MGAPTDENRPAAQQPPAAADGTGKKVGPKFLLPGEEEVFCVRFSPDDQYLASSCGSGQIRIFNTSTGKQAFTLHNGENVPTTQVRWRPHQAMSKTKNVLVAVDADGRICHWHITSGKCLHEIQEPENQLFCLDYASDGTQFATAGKKREVRVYDEATKRLSQVLEGGDSVNTPGHSNRIFSLKYHPTMRNVVVTGGWDNTVQFWDLRKGHAVRSIFGPHICGDAVDINPDGTTILTGSWRVEKQLQLWDFGSGKLVDSVPWRSGVSLSEPCAIYAAQFSKEPGQGSMIVAGGSGANEAKLFDRSTGSTTAFGTILGMSRACYTVDFAHNGGLVAVSGGDGCVRVMNVH